ncbi:MAG: extracellular solute-binding protein [Patescibacteria group bacterium]
MNNPQIPFSKNQLIVIGAVAAVAVFFILVFTGVIPGLQEDPRKKYPPVELAFWGVFDDPSVYNDVFNLYRKRFPNVTINYYLKNAETYEKDLVNALAAGKGPDVFMIHGSWLPKHYEKLASVTEQQLPIADFRNFFPQVVEQDFAPDGKIYALPLSIDTMALFYNKDFFDRKGVALPPATWKEFENLVPRLRELNPDTKKIEKAAAAIGGTDRSVNRASDLIALLMLQGGAKMTDDAFTRAVFSETISVPGGGNAPAGLNALNFYAQFANPTSPYYTWNDNLHYSIDNFAEGTTAMMFNYYYQAGALKTKNPFLNFAVAPMPQPAGALQPVNYANYWGYAVSVKSQNAWWVWDLLAFMTTNEEATAAYLKTTGKPPALRTIINAKLNDPDFGVFARQALTARSWPQVDNLAVEKSFSDMIRLVVTGEAPPEAALRRAEEEITALMKRI